MKGIQRKRIKGWRTPENCVSVARPSKFGNPFTVDEYGLRTAISNFKECILNPAMAYKHFKGHDAEWAFERFTWISENLYTLKGKDLACFCKEGTPCHRDVLLELANSGYPGRPSYEELRKGVISLLEVKRLFGLNFYMAEDPIDSLKKLLKHEEK